MSITWPQIGTKINGENKDDRFGNTISLSSDGSIVAVGAIWSDGGATITFTAASNLVTMVGHGYNDDDEIGFGGVTGAIGLADDQKYYVINKITDTFQLSLTQSGAVISILGNGSAATTITQNSENKSNLGQVRVYKNTSGTWGQLGSDINGEVYRDKFGQSVSLNTDGTRFASGARGHTIINVGDGRVRVFEYNAGTTTWDQLGNNIDASDTLENATLTISTSIVNYTAHGYSNGDAITFDSDSMPANVTSPTVWTTYYVVNKNTDDFKLSTTYGGSAITFAGGNDGDAIKIKSPQYHIGWSVSLNGTGDVVAVGSPRSNSSAGGVSIYKLNAGTWDKVGRDIGGHTSSNFGGSLSLNTDGTVVVVGATDVQNIGYDNAKNLNIPNVGGGYVGVYENATLSGNWTQKGSLIHADLDSYSTDTSNVVTFVGHGLSNNDLISFSSVNNTGFDANTLYYVIDVAGDGNSFKLSLTSGGTEITLTAGSALRNNDGEEFGYSVSINREGTRFAVGAPGNNEGGSGAGQTRIYEYNSGSGAWDQLGSDIDGSAYQLSGYSVSLNSYSDYNDGGYTYGTYVAIGSAPINDTDTGIVKIYKYLSNTWTQNEENIVGDRELDKFGSSVSMSANGKIVAAGADIFGGYVDDYTLTETPDNLVTRTNHGFVTDDRITFVTIVTTLGIIANESYYVKYVDADNFQLSDTYSGDDNTTKVLNNDGTADRYSTGIGYAKMYNAPAVPDAPTIDSATPGNLSAIIAITDGATNGSAISNYQYKIGSGAWTIRDPVSTVSPLTITGLANGTPVSIKIKAINAIGVSLESNAWSVTPAAVPSAPTNVSIQANADGTVTVTFTPGANNGSVITDYKYKIDSGSWVSGNSTSSPFNITSGLSIGVSHEIMILAVNSAGDGAISDAVSVIPATPPAAPTITDDTTGDNASAIIHFTAGASNGRDITNYKYSVDAVLPAMELGNPTTPFTITPLNNGQTYSITLYAYNAMGWSSVSVAKNVTPAAVPDSPTITGAVPGNSEIAMTFTVGEDNGSDIIRYEYSIYTPSSWNTVTLLTPATPVGDITSGTTATFDVGSLSNGTPYVVTLRAVNGNGESLDASSSSVIPATTPSAPTDVLVESGNTEAIVTYTNSISTGGSPILYYQYYLGDGSPWTQFSNFTYEFNSRPMITDLSNNKDPAYQVKVRGYNAMGGGVASSPAIELIPLNVPDTPTITGLYSGNESASVIFTQSNTNGTTITNYQYSTDNGINWSPLDPVDTTSPISIVGLANGGSYQVRIRAMNVIGSGLSSGAFTATPSGSVTAPSITSTIAGNQQITVIFTPPNDTFGVTISNYQYTLNNGTSWTARNPASILSPIVITGLTNGYSYIVKIRSVSQFGPDDTTSEPFTVTPATIPDAPTIEVTAADQSAIIAVTLSNNGGSAATNYHYSTNDGVTWITRTPASATSPITVSGLTNGVTTYKVKVRAVNIMGIGAISSPAKSVIPATVPAAPTVTVTVAPGTAIIAFTSGNNGGSTITNYQYSTNDGGIWTTRSPASTTSPILVSDLDNGTIYKVILRAINIMGNGVSSSVQTVTPLSDSPTINVPNAPTITVTPDYNSAIIAFTPGNNGGSVITNYQYSTDDGVNWTTRSPVSVISPITVSGLTNDTPYKVKLRAINIMGNGVSSSVQTVIPTLLIPQLPILVVEADNYTVKVPTENLELLTSGTPEHNRLVRDKFISDLLKSNASLLSGKKLLMDTKTLLGSSTTITKQNVRIINASVIAEMPTQYTFDLTTLSSDEGLHIPLSDVGDSILITLSSTNMIRFEKASDMFFYIYEKYINVSTPVTHIKTLGYSNEYETFSYIIGSLSGEDLSQSVPAPICFPAGTPVTTNQGNIAIQKLDPNIHTIRGKKIVAITQTIPIHKYIVSIEKDALGQNIPSATTQISKEHKILHNGINIKSKDLVGTYKGVTKIPYNGEILYNVLMEQHNTMMINNLTCETLHPENIMAKIYNGTFNHTEKNIICKELTEILTSNNSAAYKQLCYSLNYFIKEKLYRKKVDIQRGFHGIGSNIYTKHF